MDDVELSVTRGLAATVGLRLRDSHGREITATLTSEVALEMADALLLVGTGHRLSAHVDAHTGGRCLSHG